MGTPAPITTSTKLKGTAPSDSLTTSFVSGDTITVDTKPITFYDSSAVPPTSAGAVPGTTYLDLATTTVGNLLTTIDTLTGTTAASTITGGAITLHTGTAGNLSVASSNSTAFAALGFAGTVTQNLTPPLTAGTGTVIANDQQTFLNESISGGALTAYDSTGTAVNLQMRWAKTDSAALGGTHTNTWSLFYQTDPNATGTQVAWKNAGTNFTFGPAGALVSPATPSITIPNVTVGNQSLGNLAFSIPSGALTQYASTGGTATINAVTQNGYAAGQLQSVAINNNGIVVGTFSNGQNLDLASVSLSHFNGTNYLKALDGGAYAVTEQSGPAILGASGTISGSSLEGSNTDIASEFTKLIVTQQAYSANTKVITTANSMVQDLLNVLR
jgi:flagellar hook protein FlgE